MTTESKTITLTQDNIDTHFTLDYAFSLAEGVNHDIEPESPLVERFIESLRLDEINETEDDRGEWWQYEISREDAAEILNQCRR